MVSPQEGCPVRAAGIRWGGLRACDTARRDSTETGGSATELSATEAWRRAAVGDATHVRLIRTIARSNFRKNARNLDSGIDDFPIPLLVNVGCCNAAIW